MKQNKTKIIQTKGKQKEMEKQENIFQGEGSRRGGGQPSTEKSKRYVIITPGERGHSKSKITVNLACSDNKLQVLQSELKSTVTQKIS